MLDKNPDRMRYQKNGLSFLLCLLAIVFNVGAFVVSYTDDLLKPDLIIGLDIIVNIIFMLLVFMGSEKSKAYIYEWGKILIIIGIVQFVRILIVPLVFIIRDMYTTTGFILNVMFLIASGTALIFAGCVCRIRSKILKEHISMKEKEDGGESGH